MTATRSFRRYRRDFEHAQQITARSLHSKPAFLSRQRSVHSSKWSVVEVAPLHLRTRWTCGSLLCPIDGDPTDPHQRQFVVVVSVVVTLAVSLLFFKVGKGAAAMLRVLPLRPLFADV